MDDFFDAPVSIDLDITKNNKRIDPVMYSNSDDPFVYILLDKPIGKKVLDNFLRFLENEIYNKKSSSEKPPTIKIVSVLPFEPTEKELGAGVIDFYASNAIDFKKYIKPYSKVICTGRSLYSIVGSDDLLIEGFYDFIFNKTYFYSPELKSYVFPVDAIDEWLYIDSKRNIQIKDNWERFFTLKQFNTIYEIDFKWDRIIQPKIIVPDDPNSLLLAWEDSAVWLAIDIETKYLDSWNPEGSIICLTLSFDGKTGYFMDWDKIDKDILSRFLRKKKLILHNGKYDAKWLILNGVDRSSIHICHDTWNGSHLLNEMQAGRLKSGAYLYTSFGGYDRELEKYKKKYPACKEDYSLIPRPIMIKYATMDPIVTFQLFEAQRKEIERIDREFPNPNSNWPLKRYFYDIMIPAVETFLDIEIEGMPINIQKLQEVSDELQIEIDKILIEIYKTFKMTAEDINIDSDEQLGMLLEARGLPNHGRGKKKLKKNVMYSFLTKLNSRVKPDYTKGIYLTGEDQLKKWIKDGYKEIEIITKYRELTTLMKTFVGKKENNSGAWQYIKSDGKFHANFGPMLTQSHRNWCKEPNMQNWPHHNKWAEKIRTIFASPSPEYDIGDQDGSGLQLRIGAILSGDEEMKKIFNSHGDMHTVTAVQVLKRDMTFEQFKKALKDDTNKELQEELKLIRYKAKTANFQLEFGATSFNYAQTIISKEWPKTEIDKYIKENNLEDQPLKFFERAMQEKKFNVDMDFCACWSIAKDIREKFFNTYKGLQEWIKTTGEFAKTHGYVRSPFGAIRRLPQLIRIGIDDLPSKTKNLLNISVNSPVQNYEVFLIMKTMNGISTYIRENPEVKSRLMGNIHDAIGSFTYRPEKKLMIGLSKKFFEEDIPENNHIPMIIESEFADYWNKNQVWGYGENE